MSRDFGRERYSRDSKGVETERGDEMSVAKPRSLSGGLESFDARRASRFGLRAVLDAIVRARRFVVISGSRSLAVKWSHPTRLETRTKESNMCASRGVTETPVAQ